LRQGYRILRPDNEATVEAAVASRAAYRRVQELIMNASENVSSHRPRKARVAAMTGLIAAGAIAGGVLASTAGASAATDSSTAATATTPAATSTTAPTNPTAGDPKSSTPVRSDEKATTAAIAATLKTKALAAVPGGTVYRIETDAGDATYEAHMTKADGSLVTVKFDANLQVTSVETGMGQGDPAPAGGGPGAGGPALGDAGIAGGQASAGAAA
jgi:uncharacterized membrane protein YkoI